MAIASRRAAVPLFRCNIVTVAPLRTGLHLNVGSAYLVKGILHDYLGPAIVPDTGQRVYAFRRREWRPNTPDQLPVTLVAEDAVEGSVTRFGAPRQNGGV